MAKKKTAPKKKATSKKATAKKGTAKLGDPVKSFEQIKSHIAEMEEHFEKFDNGVKASVGKIRKSAMEIRKLTGTLRKEIQAAKSSM